MLYPAKDVALISFCSSFIVTESANSVLHCQHASTCCFLCLMLGCYVDEVMHYLYGFNLPLRTAEEIGRRVSCASLTRLLVPSPFTAGQELSLPPILVPGLCVFPLCLLKVPGGFCSFSWESKRSSFKYFVNSPFLAGVY